MFYDEGSFIVYEAFALTQCLNIKMMKVVCISRMLHVVSLGAHKTVIP
jgi:hypothetical protein